MWIAGDADTKIYIFGTFHALDGKTDWFNDEVESAAARLVGIVRHELDSTAE